MSLRGPAGNWRGDRKSTRLNSSHTVISYAVFCLKKKIRVVLPVVDRCLHGDTERAPSRNDADTSHRIAPRDQQREKRVSRLVIRDAVSIFRRQHNATLGPKLDLLEGIHEIAHAHRVFIAPRREE